MKKTLLFFLSFLTLTLLCGCAVKEQSNMDNKITLINEVKDADVWILPNTKENKKTTVWGKAAAPKVKTGESRETLLPDAGDNGLYIFRMIDTESFFYSADGIKLEQGWIVKIKEKDTNSAELEVTDKNGSLNTYKVFKARL